VCRLVSFTWSSQFAKPFPQPPYCPQGNRIGICTATTLLVISRSGHGSRTDGNDRDSNRTPGHQSGHQSGHQAGPQEQQQQQDKSPAQRLGSTKLHMHTRTMRIIDTEHDFPAGGTIQDSFAQPLI
jgi:hypothetical protein